MAVREFTGVATADELNADISAIDQDSQAGAGNGTAYSITFAPNATLIEDANLTAINLNGSDTLVINGGPTGATLDGDGAYRGFFVYQGTVTIENLTIQNAVAQGGAGGPGGGGGAGLGGGLFVANDPAHNGLPSAVTLVNVTFSNDQAAGGAGGRAGQASGGGGGGGLGGAGGADNGGSLGSGGGGGIGGAGGSPGSDGGSGIVTGATGGGAAGGVFTAQGGAAGGGGGGEPGGTGGGGGGGIGGATGTKIVGGAGGFGGGGGGSTANSATGGYGAGAGGFGGGGGFSSYANGGAGGFGGGGGGGENEGGAGGFGAGKGSSAAGAGEGVGSGGGGLGAGGAVFVQQGASLTVSGGKLSGDTVNAGGSPGNAGQALGSGIFLQGNQSITFGTGATAGQITEIDDVIADQDATAQDGNNNGQVIIEGDGIVRFKGVNTYGGGTLIKSGTLDLEAVGGSSGAGTGEITFAPGANATLMLGPSSFTTGVRAGVYAGGIVDFDVGDTIDLRGFAYVPGKMTASYGGLYLTVSNGTTAVSIPVSPDGKFSRDSTFVTKDDGARGTDIELVCFASGTMICTAREQATVDVAVEHLVVGDVVITASGAPRPIRWLGHRTIDCRRHPRPRDAMPIRIAAHAFGERRPARDLFVSPGHAICVDILGEVLIPAGALVNGTTIQQVEVDAVTYWHVELDSHDILLAENMPAESFLDMGNRAFFLEADVVDLSVGPDADPARRTHADFCRPFHADGPLVAVVKARLRQRAEACGWALTCELDLHLRVDGRRVDPVVRGATARFHLPAGSKDVWLMAPTARPCDVMESHDARDLGVPLHALHIDDGFEQRAVSIDHPLLRIGFHGVEDGLRRWTAGAAQLPAALWAGIDTDFYVRIDLAGPPIHRWRNLQFDARVLKNLQIKAKS